MATSRRRLERGEGPQGRDKKLAETTATEEQRTRSWFGSLHSGLGSRFGDSCGLRGGLQLALALGFLALGEHVVKPGFDAGDGLREE